MKYLFLSFLLIISGGMALAQQVKVDIATMQI